jgi:hypothetical protein
MKKIPGKTFSAVVFFMTSALVVIAVETALPTPATPSCGRAREHWR